MASGAGRRFLRAEGAGSFGVVAEGTGSFGVVAEGAGSFGVVAEGAGSFGVVAEGAGSGGLDVVAEGSDGSLGAADVDGGLEAHAGGVRAAGAEGGDLAGGRGLVVDGGGGGGGLAAASLAASGAVAAAAAHAAIPAAGVGAALGSPDATGLKTGSFDRLAAVAVKGVVAKPDARPDDPCPLHHPGRGLDAGERAGACDDVGNGAG
jgi:hypothetical protein